MTLENIEPLITCYVDGELKDEQKINATKNLIETNKEAAFDYNVQVFVKSLVSEKLKIKPVPEKIKNKIIKKIKPSKNFLSSFFS